MSPNWKMKKARSCSGRAFSYRAKRSLRLFALLKITGRLPSLPHTRACSTIGAERLNFRVRDGNGWDPLAKVTQNLPTSAGNAATDVKSFGSLVEYLTGATYTQGELDRVKLCVRNKFYGQAERAISNGKLNVLLRFHIRPIKLVVFQCSSYLRWEISSWGRFRAYMHSALILTEFRYPAMPLA